MLPAYPPKLSRRREECSSDWASRFARARSVTDMRRESVTIRAGDRSETIPTRTVLWAAGVLASPLGRILSRRDGRGARQGGPRDRGAGSHRARPSRNFRDRRSWRISAIRPGNRFPAWRSPRFKQGRYVAKAIERRLRGKKMPVRFTILDKGNLATIGRAAAVADLNWLRLSGLPAWLIWIFIHLIYIVEFQESAAGTRAMGMALHYLRPIGAADHRKESAAARPLETAHIPAAKFAGLRQIRAAQHAKNGPEFTFSPNEFIIQAEGLLRAAEEVRSRIGTRLEQFLFTSQGAVLQSGHPAPSHEQKRKVDLYFSFALLILSLSAVIFTRGWADYRQHLRAMQAASKNPSNVIDTRPLDTAQQLAQLAITHTEQDYAQQALTLADHSVDLAFAAAMIRGGQLPPLTEETRKIAERIKEGSAAVAADQNRIAQFTAALAHAQGARKTISRIL